jgi:hypothetical protein
MPLNNLKLANFGVGIRKFHKNMDKRCFVGDGDHIFGNGNEKGQYIYLIRIDCRLNGIKPYGAFCLFLNCSLEELTY